MRVLFFLLLLLAAEISFSQSASGQSPLKEKRIWERLIGEWRSEDASHLGPSNAVLKVEKTLDGNLLKLTYQLSSIADETNNEMFAGVAYYSISQGKVGPGFWADSIGNLFSISPEITKHKLTARWERASNPVGRTVYELETDGKLTITDHVLRDGEWLQFNHMRFVRSDEDTEVKEMEKHVLGIGGLFFRGDDPTSLSNWYEEKLAVIPPPQSYDQRPWTQEAGCTVFAPFETDTDYFGTRSQQWMVNFRVRDLDGLIEKLRNSGEDVSDPILLPNGRFARLMDPEGNPIELWEPSE